jgi:Na+/H+-dicarboxylate symporter
MKFWKNMELHTKIILGLVFGALFGVLVGDKALWLQPIGDIFLRLITMIVLPLVFSSLFVGTASLGDIRKLGRIGAKTLLFYFGTTIIAIIIGLLAVNILQPGKYIKKETKNQLYKNYIKADKIDIKKVNEKTSLTDTFVNIVPKNPAQSFTKANMLQIIFIAIIFGIALTLLPKERGEPLLNFFNSVSDVSIKVVDIIMKFAPYGVFALLAAIIGKYGYKILITLFTYSITVILALFVHTFIILPFFVKFLSKISIKEFLKKMREVMLLAFSTSSSNATLPVTMETVEKKFKVPSYISSFVLPLGATINMDGTGLYQGVAAVFIAQVYGIHLGLSGQITIVLTATLASIGTAGVPGVGIITLAMILRAINVPIEGIALILGVDRILDMLRTVSNVLGDAAAALVIAKSEKEI